MIAYFSGTGNCKYVAERIASHLNDTAVSIETGIRYLPLKENESFGIVTPTHWLQLPVPVREFLEMTAFQMHGINYFFLVATYGSSPGCIGEDARRILARKGIVLDAAFSIKMPDTWTPIFDLSNPLDVINQNQEAEAVIDQVISKIEKKERGNQTDSRLPYSIRIFTDPFLNEERKTKHFHVDETCIGCGLCARKCPAKAIEIQNHKPVWAKDRCILCLRCLHHCPKFAIQYGNGKTLQHGQYHHPGTKV